MSLPPKASGDILYATLWNIVQALAENAMRPTDNLAGLADNAAARSNIGAGSQTDLTAAQAAADAAQADATQGIADAATAQAAADAANAIIEDSVSIRGDVAEPVVGFVDENGEVALGVDANGETLIPGGRLVKASGDIVFGIMDSYGEVAGYVGQDGTGYGVLSQVAAPEPEPTTYSTAEISQRNARALALAAAVITRTNTTAARPVWTYSGVLSYGQSLSNGWEGWPSLSKTQPHDNLMVGTSVHPSSESSSTWAATGTAAFNPLVATVHSGGAVIADATVAAYSPGNVARGETVLEGALNMWRRQQLAWRGLLSDSTRRLVGSACGVGGKSIEELSKGASPELFNRLRGAATAAQTLATAASGTYGVSAILWLQGEHNSAGWSGTGDKDTYKSLCETLQQDVIADIATAIAGQSAPPAFFCYQVGGLYTSDTLELSIPQAQLECAQQFQDWYLVAPSYPVTDKAGHLDPNGYRWLGMQFGKVLHQVLDLGRGWLPLHPIQATWRGAEVLIDFHVPQPPLQFQNTYTVLTATDYTAKGFRVTDDDGSLTISSVEIVSDACVRLTVSRTLAANPFVWYGSKTTHNGNGNLCDSDATIASDVYEYASGTGQYAGADIVALKDNPYPLWNWCVLFRIAITYDPAS